MSDPRSNYLRSLGEVLSHESDPTVARTIQSEIEAHLDASIQARMELGDPHEEAVLHAIAALGAPESYATDVAEVHTPEIERNEKRLIGAAMGFSFVIASNLFVLPFALWADVDNTAYLKLYLSLSVCALTLVGAFSFLTRKFLPVRMVKVAAVAGAGVWMALSLVWLDANAEGGAGVFTRWQAASQILAQDRIIEQNLHAQTVANSIYSTRLAKGAPPSELRRQITELKRKGDSAWAQRKALEAAAGRSVPERMMATAAIALQAGGAAAAFLLAFNFAGSALGRRWRRGHSKGAARA